MNRRKLLRKVLSGSKNLRFADIMALAQAFGFRLARVSGSHHINIFYSDDDQGYIADIPDLQACSAFGATPDAALHEVEIAKAAWLAAAKARRKPIPAPRYRPAIYQAASIT